MGTRVVRVLPDLPRLDRSFDYLVPDEWREPVQVGTPVRVELQGRFVRGWVVGVEVEPASARPLKPLRRHGGVGPDAALVELAGWAAWRWAGRAVHLLRTATPDPQVHRLPSPPAWPEVGAPPDPDGLLGEVTAATGPVLLRLPPAHDPTDLVVALGAAGPVLVLVPTADAADGLAGRVRARGLPVARWPAQRASAAAGAVTVGTRAAAWARVGGLTAVIVLDEHDEAHQGEQTPTWHARDVGLERGRRAGVPVVLTSPVPSLHGLTAARLLRPSRSRERAGWPVVEVVDRRGDRPGAGSLISDRLVELVRSDRRVVVVLNRKGRSRLLVCATCETTAACERCGAAVHLDHEDLRCPRCGHTRPVVCAHCDSVRMKQLRPGVTRLRDEIAALVRDDVGEVSGDQAGPGPDTRVVVGTEAALHRVGRADVVVLADVDQELLAPRYRAGEQALALLARAARLVGGRSGGGRLVVQTRRPDHEVIDAVLHADPGRLEAAEQARRELLGLPPAAALARLTGPGAAALAAAIGGDDVDHAGGPVSVRGPVDGAYLVRAPDPATLADAIGAVERPSERIRVEVDPPRV